MQGLQAHTAVPCETFVVAYRFSPENLAKVQADFPWVRWIVSDGTRGFSENNNLALRQARGRYCFIVNDDTLMDMPVIDRLAEDFARLPKDAAAVSPPASVSRTGASRPAGAPRGRPGATPGTTSTGSMRRAPTAGRCRKDSSGLIRSTGPAS